ncbi:uncharacterized protein LOC111083235, partial [Limulus polyphemus]|uniref:Uncharacterized protein LOC111083235 n=1 Tax=Limulus polyphemus TaxID=6850 RepID=A0ABM1RVA0_LIMPO
FQNIGRSSKTNNSRNSHKNFNLSIQGDSLRKKQTLEDRLPVIDEEGNGDPGYEFVFADNLKGFLTDEKNEEHFEDSDSTSEDDYEDSYDYLDNGTDDVDEACRRKYDLCMESGSTNPGKLRCQKSYFLCLLDDDEDIYNEL